MEYKKKLKQRLYLGISYILFGLVVVIADVLKGFENTFFFSFGVAMLVMGILRILRYRKITTDEKNMRHQELMETDERNLMMAERARSWAFSFSVFAAGVLVIVLNLLGYQEEALPFAWFVCGMTLLYWICRNIMRKKY